MTPEEYASLPHDTKVTNLLVVDTTFTWLAIFIIGLRLYTRRFVTSNLQADDYLIAVVGVSKICELVQVTGERNVLIINRSSA